MVMRIVHVIWILVAERRAASGVDTRDERRPCTKWKKSSGSSKFIVFDTFDAHSALDFLDSQEKKIFQV